MLDRRDFLKHSAALASIASAGVVAADAPDPIRSIQFVIVDEQFEDSVTFAKTLVANGARAYSVQQDLGRLWFGELGREFAAGASVAGLTAHSELLICSSFARQRGARVRFEGEHDCRGVNTLTHALRMEDSLPDVCTMLARADTQWPHVLAMSINAASTRRDSFRQERLRTATLRSATHPGSLFSWLIA